MPAYEYWLQGELEQALREVTQVASGINSRSGRERNAFRWRVGSFYVALGRLAAAEEISESLRDSTRTRERRALVALAKGDKEAVRELLRRPPPSYRSAILLVRAGLLREAAAMLADPETVSSANSPILPVLWQRIVRGELALARGKTAEAIELLERTVLHSQRPWATAYWFLAAESLARAWEQQGDPARALEVLEDVAQQKQIAIFFLFSGN